ncbi:MAG: hypothetical protein HY865_16150 [Chloroflexi bacterium]|nr:hypothetical protein [Chloroflexota bacterium]
MPHKKDNLLKVLTVLLLLLSVTLRVIGIPHTNHDMTVYNLPWYQTIYQEGIGKALATNFSNYAPPYTYFLALATLTHDFIPPLTTIKLIPIFFDILGAFFIHKIVKLKYQQGVMPCLAAAVFFAAATVVLNSAYWGQADSLYTTFLLACLYFLLTERPFTSMVAFGIAFSIKAQAVFLLPFLGVMAIRKKIRWLYFGMIPIVYLLAILPVVIFGRPLPDALLIYVKQSSSYPVLSMDAPNIYILIPNEWYSSIMPVGIIATIILITYWVYSTSQSRMDLDGKHIVLIAFISTALVPFLLPKMHDRYFYPADVLSIVLAFYWPALWFIPILYQFSSAGAISVFLFDADPSFVVFGFLFNTFALMTALRAQRLTENHDTTTPKISSALSWLVTIITPLILLGASMDLLLTPAFIRIQYAMPHIFADQRGFGKSERFKWATQSVDYLTNSRQTRYLDKLEFIDGTPVFDEHEITILDNAKKMAQKMFKYWRLSLATLFIFGLLAWVGDWLPKFRNGVRRGGWLTIVLAILLAIGGVVFFCDFDPVGYFEGPNTLSQLFPIDFWWASFIFVLCVLGGGGFLLTRIPANLQD